MLTISTATAHTFDFKLEGSDEVYSLPLAKNLPLSVLRRFTAISMMDDGDEKNLAAIDLQLGLLSEYMGDAADALTGETVQAIFEAWNVASGAELGE